MKNPELLKDALLTTARRITEGRSNYQWGHMGRCNVGQLVQTLTGMDSARIVASANLHLDEWSSMQGHIAKTPATMSKTYFVSFRHMAFRVKTL